MNKISKKFLPMVLAATLVSAPSLFGQRVEPATAPPLVGAWEYIGPVTVDCKTREPNGPEVRVALLFNQGGTMFVEDTFPFEGPYRTTGPGIWKREAGGEFSYGHMHYSFAPDNTFLYTIKQRSRLRLVHEGDSYVERGTFEGIAPDGTVIFTGCFQGTANRITF